MIIVAWIITLALCYLIVYCVDELKRNNGKIGGKNVRRNG